MNKITIYLALAFIFLSHISKAQTFNTRWDLSIAGTSATSISIGTATSGTATYTWQQLPVGASGAGSWTGTTLTIAGLPAGATIRLLISPTNFERIVINDGLDRQRLMAVGQWGTTVWTSMLNAFVGCSNMQVNAADVPNLSSVGDMSNMFFKCSLINPTNINLWNTANVTNMSNMFNSATAFNQPINSWNTANVTNMSYMFTSASAFNQPINTVGSSWNTTAVTNMAGMFIGASAFNQPINSWNTANVTNMSYMFSSATVFNQPLNSWNTANVTNMSGMFSSATAFNQLLTRSGSLWNTGAVTNMSFMFFEANAFNQSLNSWNTANVTNMSYMFFKAAIFNQPLNSWNTANVTDMSGMFSSATAFNQPINTSGSSWNTANVTNMSYMFNSATAFNQLLNSWNTANVTDMSGMFFKAAIFNQPLTRSGNSWNTGAVTNMSFMFSEANAFNQPLNSWNTISVNNMSYMFLKAAIFNQPINTWNTASVTDMSGMFNSAPMFNSSVGWANTSAVTNMFVMFFEAAAFNQPINTWNTSNVTNMGLMFLRAPSFNQNISSWNVSNVSNMQYMFSDATAFNFSIGGWTLRNNVDMTFMLDLCGMDCAAYSATLAGWSANAATPNSRSLGASGRFYTSATVASRTNLTTTKSWTIIGDAVFTPALVVSGQVITAVPTCGDGSYSNPADLSKAILLLNRNGNTITPTSVIINNQGTLTGGGGTFSNTATDYYQSTNASFNTIRVSKRIVSVIAPGSFVVNGGVIVRVYYSAAQNASMVSTSWPGSSPLISSGWYKTSDNTAQAVVNSMTPNFLSNTVAINPIASGVLAGIDWVEFRVTSFSSFGFLAKTDVPLPIDLLSFTADCNKDAQVILKWSTANEINNNFFTIERSVDMINWQIIKTISGSNLSNQSQNYSFVDTKASTRVLYYRLSQTDFDGKSKYYKVIKTNCGDSFAKQLNISPNPCASGKFVINTDALDSDISIVDVLGMVIYQTKIIMSETQIDLSGYPSGMYYIKSASKHGISSQKISIAK